MGEARAGLADHYGVLGVAPDATLEQIEAAFRSQARRWHPDASADPRAPERMVALNEARAVLADPSRRAGYDRELLAARPCRPRLVPSTVDFGAPSDDRRAGSTVRVLNEGRQPATVRVQPEFGAFWALTSVRGSAAPGEVAQLDLEIRCATGLAPGVHSDSLRVFLDEEEAVLAISAEVIAVGPRSASRAEAPDAFRYTTHGRPPHRSRSTTRRGVALAGILAVALAVWPGSPGRAVLNRIVDDVNALGRARSGAGAIFGGTQPLRPGAGKGASDRAGTGDGAAAPSSASPAAPPSPASPAAPPSPAALSSGRTLPPVAPAVGPTPRAGTGHRGGTGSPGSVASGDFGGQ